MGWYRQGENGDKKMNTDKNERDSAAKYAPNVLLDYERDSDAKYEVDTVYNTHHVDLEDDELDLAAKYCTDTVNGVKNKKSDWIDRLQGTWRDASYGQRRVDDDHNASSKQ